MDPSNAEEEKATLLGLGFDSIPDVTPRRPSTEMRDQPPLSNHGTLQEPTSSNTIGSTRAACGLNSDGSLPGASSGASTHFTSSADYAFSGDRRRKKVPAAAPPPHASPLPAITGPIPTSVSALATYATHYQVCVGHVVEVRGGSISTSVRGTTPSSTAQKNLSSRMNGSESPVSSLWDVYAHLDDPQDLRQRLIEGLVKHANSNVKVGANGESLSPARRLRTSVRDGEKETEGKPALHPIVEFVFPMLFCHGQDESSSEEDAARPRLDVALCVALARMVSLTHEEAIFRPGPTASRRVEIASPVKNKEQQWLLLASSCAGVVSVSASSSSAKEASPGWSSVNHEAVVCSVASGSPTVGGTEEIEGASAQRHVISRAVVVGYLETLRSPAARSVPNFLAWLSAFAAPMLAFHATVGTSLVPKPRLLELEPELYAAAWFGRLDVLRSLRRQEQLEHPSETPVEWLSNWRSALHGACAGNQVVVLKWLFGAVGVPVKGHDGSKRFFTSEFEMAGNGHSQLLKRYGMMMDDETLNHDRSTVLHTAVRRRAHLLIPLIAAQEGGRALLDAKTSYGNTPLHTACSLRDWQSARALINAGAHASLKNDVGETPLHVAALLGSYECAAVVLLRNSSILVGRHYGKAGHFALSNQPSMTRNSSSFLEWGSSREYSDRVTTTEFVDDEEEPLDFNPQVNVVLKDVDKNTAIDVAINTAHAPMLGLMLKHPSSTKELEKKRNQQPEDSSSTSSGGAPTTPSSGECSTASLKGPWMDPRCLGNPALEQAYRDAHWYHTNREDLSLTRHYSSVQHQLEQVE